MTAIPPMLVTFDDGSTVTVVPKPRDMVGAEAAGHDFTMDGQAIHGMYAVAFACLQRMERAGTLPEGVEVPPSLGSLIDGADVQSEDDEDPEGNA